MRYGQNVKKFVEIIKKYRSQKEYNFKSLYGYDQVMCGIASYG